MNKKLVSIFLILLIGVYFLFPKKNKNKIDHKYSPSFTHSTRKLRPTKLKKYVGQKLVTKPRSIGNVSKKANVSRDVVEFIRDMPKVENQYLKRKKIKLVKGIFATHRPINNKRILGEYQGHYLYERSDELENVFISEDSSRIMFWSGEVLLSGRALSGVVEGIEGVEVIKELNNFLIIRFSNNSDIIQYLDLLMSDKKIESIEMDLNSQRRVKI